jgi:hypothetical protein
MTSPAKVRVRRRSKRRRGRRALNYNLIGMTTYR